MIEKGREGNEVGSFGSILMGGVQAMKQKPWILEFGIWRMEQGFGFGFGGADEMDIFIYLLLILVGREGCVLFFSNCGCGYGR